MGQRQLWVGWLCDFGAYNCWGCGAVAIYRNQNMVQWIDALAHINSTGSRIYRSVLSVIDILYEL